LKTLPLTVPVGAGGGGGIGSGEPDDPPPLHPNRASAMAATASQCLVIPIHHSLKQIKSSL
jgi:hypothetical protein